MKNAVERWLRVVDAEELPITFADAEHRAMNASALPEPSEPTRRSGRSRLVAALTAAVIFGVAGVFAYRVFSGEGPVTPGAPEPTSQAFVSFYDESRNSDEVASVNLATGEIGSSFSVGAGPTLALAPDASSLYVISTQADGSTELATIDPASGKDESTIKLVAAGTGVGERVQSVGPECCEPATVSPDGQTLFFLVLADKEGHEFAISAFDTLSGEVIGTSTSLGDDCDASQIIAPDSRSAVVSCPMLQQIKEVSFGPAGLVGIRTLDTPGTSDRLDPQGNSLLAAGASSLVLTPGSHTLFAVTGSGMVLKVDLESFSITSEHDLGLGDTQIIPGGRVAFVGDSLAVGIGSTSDFNDAVAYDVEVVDPTSWTTVSKLSSSKGFYSMAASSRSTISLLNQADGIASTLNVDTGQSQSLFTSRETTSLGEPTGWVVAP